MPRRDPSQFLVPATFWDRPQVVDALRGRDMGALFTLLRKYAGASQPGIGMRIGGLSQPEVSRIANGRRVVTDLAVFEQIADGLGMPDRSRTALGLAPRSLPAADATRLTAERPAEPADTGLRLPWDAPNALRGLDAVVEAVEVDRRRFLLLSGAVLTAPSHEWLLARSTEDVGRTSGRRVDPAAVDQLDHVTSRLRRMDDDLGGGALLGVVQGQARYVVGLIGDRSYTDSVGRRLYASAAELLRLSGWLAFDSGLHADAQRSFLAALRASHAAGDRALGANVLGFMSCQAKDLAQYDEAITLAETARASHPGSSPKVAAIIALRAAEAHANAGSITETRRAIDDAFDRYRDSGTSPDWAYWLDEAQIHAQAGYCYQKLEDGDRARDHLQSSLDLQDGAYSREGALRLTLLASTYVTQHDPDLDAACTTGSQAVELLTGQVDSARCVGHVRRLMGQLAPHDRNPRVRDLLDSAKPLLAA